MRVLVTGGLGFIGCNLTSRLLQDGHEVIIYDNASRSGVLSNLEWLREQHPSRVNWVQGDVRDAAAVARAIEGAGMVFHFAAQVAVTTSVADPRTDFEVNALGTVNVLEAARQLNPLPIVLYTSTNKVYGNLEGVQIEETETRYRLVDYALGIPETFPLDFHSPYGCSKGASDQYVRDYHRIFGLPTIVFRMSCIYGRRQMGNEDQGWVAHLARTALQGGEVRIFGDGKQVRDLLYVEDLIEAMLSAVRRVDRTAGQVYNLGGGPAHTLSVWVELREYLRDLLGRVPEAQMGPWRPGDQRIYITDIGKAQRDLDWTPKVAVAEGLRRMVEDWKLRGVVTAAR
ncbi:MAG: GDP-mannose 4,6-dehydratase [Terriglobia bacterium]|jgi:CDP-paratose 2-epimerase